MKRLIVITSGICLFVLLSTNPVFSQDMRTNTGGRSFTSPNAALPGGHRYMGSSLRYGGIGDTRSSMLGGRGYGRQGILEQRSGFAGGRFGRQRTTGTFQRLSKYKPKDGKPILAQMYDDSFTGSYRNWYQPEAAITAQAPIAIKRNLSGNAQGAENPKNTLPLEQLVNNYIMSHRQNYLQLGWEKFKEGKYRAACDVFLLADSVSYDNPRARSQVKLAVLQAAVASRQYMLASSSLKWLITPHFKTKQLPNPEFLSRINNVRTNYGIESDFDEHVLSLNLYARNNVKSAELTALRSVVLWSRGDVSDALHYASRLNQMKKSGPQYMILKQLYPLMIEADRVNRSSLRTDAQKADTSSKSPGSVPLNLPFEMPGE
ncbi:MAG: hypothetical protein ACYTF1_07525 [Planctomycetota bacterium]